MHIVSLSADMLKKVFLELLLRIEHCQIPHHSWIHDIYDI